MAPTLNLSVHSGGGMTFVAGQTLSGNGTVVGAATIANGATLSPGSPSGTLTVSGNLVLNSFLQTGVCLGHQQRPDSGQRPIDVGRHAQRHGCRRLRRRHLSDLLVLQLGEQHAERGDVAGWFLWHDFQRTQVNNRILLVVGAAADPYTAGSRITSPVAVRAPWVARILKGTA